MKPFLYGRCVAFTRSFHIEWKPIFTSAKTVRESFKKKIHNGGAKRREEINVLKWNCADDGDFGMDCVRVVKMYHHLVSQNVIGNIVCLKKGQHQSANIRLYLWGTLPYAGILMVEKSGITLAARYNNTNHICKSIMPERKWIGRFKMIYRLWDTLVSDSEIIPPQQIYMKVSPVICWADKRNMRRKMRPQRTLVRVY